MTFNRREFVLAASAIASLRAQAVRSYSAEMPNMLPGYLARRLDEEARHWDAERAKIKNANGVRDRNRLVLAKIREMAGPLPPKTPLAARTNSVLERPGYRIENVLFQSQAEYWIPANVYVPTGASGPFPAVVLQRGHFDSVRMSPDYQQLHIELVKNGFVVLAYDSIGQGERRQYYESDAEPFDDLLSPTLEHCAIGGLLSLIGESAAAWFAWDGIRAVDYLSERPDVDRAKIGCADHTDTGWSALLHCVFDDRIQCASLHAHGTARRWPVDLAAWNITEDSEQFLFPAAIYGIDVPDTLAAMAPRPLQILVEDQSGDFANSAAYLTLRYGQLERPDHFFVEHAVPGNDWPNQLRHATVRWFRHWLGSSDATASEEIEALPEPYSVLRVTPQGSLRESKIGKPIYSIIREHAAKLPPALTQSALKEEIRRMLHLPGTAAALNARELTSDQLSAYRLSTVEFLSEPGIYVAGSLYRPPRPNGECIVYTSGDVASFVPEVDDDLGGPARKDDPDRDAPDEFADRLARKGYTVLSVDVRGLGRTTPSAARRDIRGPYEHLHNSDVALANMAWSLGDSLFAMRVRDLLRAVEYASQFGRVRLAASEMGALWALFAGAVDARIYSISIQRGLASYHMLTEHGRYMQPVSQFIPGVLKQLDLPQVAAAIAPRRLTILDPTDHLNMPVERAIAMKIYAPAQAAYANLRASKDFKLSFGQELEDQFTDAA